MAVTVRLQLDTNELDPIEDVISAMLEAVGDLDFTITIRRESGSPTVVGVAGS